MTDLVRHLRAAEHILGDGEKSLDRNLVLRAVNEFLEAMRYRKSLPTDLDGEADGILERIHRHGKAGHAFPVLTDDEVWETADRILRFTRLVDAAHQGRA